MDPYRLLLESLGIMSHNIPVDEVSPPSPIFSPQEYWSPPDFVLDYAQEVSYNLNCKKFHRYSRKDRFKFILLQLLGISGDTPKHVINLVALSLSKSVRKNKIWNDIRAILKKHKLRKYYNRIPSLIFQLSKKKPEGVTYTVVKRIIQDFADFDYQFNNHFRSNWNRKYFPNMRFIALKLIARHEIKYPYHIPLVRTSRKKKYLENLYSCFELSW